MEVVVVVQSGALLRALRVQLKRRVSTRRELELIQTQMAQKPMLRAEVGMRVRCELKLIQTQMAQKPMLRAEVGMRVRCANKASAG